MNNQIIVKLRGEYLSLAGRMVIYSQRYGSDHLAVIALRTQMRELQIRTQ
jgi:succinoglycan biosynthesis transport protein ExoP